MQLTSLTRHQNLRRHQLCGFFLILLLLAQAPSRAQCLPDVYHDGEILTYAVRWGFFRLGTVEVHQRLIDAAEGRYELLLRVRSAEHLPFIDVSFDNCSEQIVQEHGLRREIIVSGSDTTIYRADGTGRMYYTEDRTDGAIVHQDTIDHPFPMFDALGLFMFARCFSHRPVDTTLATLLEHAAYETDLRTGLQHETIAVDAFDEPKQAVLLSGFAHWVGTGYAGMTGAFTGWISDDEMAVPLRADVEIFLGSISLELESMERSPERIALLRTSASDTGRPQ